MKRILWTTLFAGLVLAATGSNVAVAQGGPSIVTRPIFASDASGHYVGPAVGIVTFNTETGDWTVSTRNRLPQSDFNYYYPALSTSPVLVVPGPGRWVQDSYYWAGYFVSVDGVVEASGTVGPDELEFMNQALAARGIFILATNSI